MSHLILDSDPIHPGQWTLQSSNPAVLAAVPDAIVQVLDLKNEVLAAWALHPDEQAGIRDAAYHDELAELGPQALVEVRELSRPWQPNVVWVDRYHLLVGSAPASVGSRLLGLYVGSKGRIVLSVFHPSVAALIGSEYDTMPSNRAHDWDQPMHVDNARFVIRFDPENLTSLRLRCSQPMAMRVQDALLRLAQTVTAW